MYQVLARKYRPRNFNELVGQNHVSRALTSALERGRLHHAYLFTGTRGVGKTTIARILAKCLNCETGVTSTPCEVCPTCTAVNEGRFIDLIEIDAASRTKVEDTRELLDNVPYAPTQGRFKVYLIDEVHMLSTHSFNALLKTLEEPPEHVKFLFATTDPQKLPITVISRCLQFTLRPLAVDEITEHLGNILNKENIQAEQDAIWQIAESAQGSLRDALSLTDQAIAYGQGAIQHQDVKEMLGLIDRTIIYDLILAIHQNQKQRVSELLMQFRQQALDVSLVLDQLISTLHELALLQYLPELSLKYSAEINKKIMQLSQQIAAQDLQLYYQIACKGRAELQLAVTQEQGFEMSVLRMLAFRPLQPNEVLVAQANSAVVESVQQTAILTSDPETALQQDAQDADVDAAFEATAITQNAEPEFKPELDDVDVSESAEDNKPSVDASQQSDQIVFDPSSDEVLFDLDEADEFNAQSNDDEPNSDDFLFDEIVPLDLKTQNDAPLEDVVAIAEPAVQAESSDLANEVLSADSVQDTQVVENESLQTVAAIVEPVQLEQVSTASADLMPQDILQLQPQQLVGEWTVEKWEYWFRSSGLSPAVQELAQQGLMAGQINAESVFMIPQRYEQLLTQLRHVLEDALKAEWPQTRFDVKYAEVETITPYTMQAQRKQKAFQRAHELLQNEDTVKGLVQTFDGELHNIQLK
ncbi:DNA polymerase III subunit gamma/tau [Acinetobacter johnsonii]|uniref:DNA polymerase III subunit gamma/tau n=1 Tax=Acinetobacter johnsonii TaxID=40214 RepID=UPI0012505025|nr:DNA polymerase III subunit gamma/tau [Acinetobacter johnsonii]MDH0835621.1 DNA polymerase III subunit gamma/tau [Acinetobacter johnsonii]MDH0839404.1 DNA polymerase III subunit gamma/tau [Acinetobacter johnsonii]QPF33704.1 DNA polymerase III subunit gamma/tau [Acinetobacter johnsonii]QQT57662.1 DNA polymerase III subunit gamma/tau [Acinetobacter johnsonii]